MKTLNKKVVIFCFCSTFLLISLVIGGKPAVASVGEIFWNVIYWIGDSLAKTSVGQFIEKGFNAIFSFFDIHFGKHIAPDYWGALTGSYSSDMGFKVNIDGVDYSCNLPNPRMHRDSVDSPWQLDSFEETFLRDCGETLNKGY
ncbi:MAG: hypothetical protein HC862_02990 [Scytonema sp. RU_4_4]|nr:hypothetical protein [Scytonema sp. RU_4_4]